MSAQNDLAEFVADHPRMLGILFFVMLLLSQAGNGAATHTHMLQP